MAEDEAVTEEVAEVAEAPAEDAATPEAEAEAEVKEKTPAKFKTVGDSTVTPDQYSRWHEQNSKLYQAAEIMTVADLVKRLADHKKFFATTNLHTDTDHAETTMQRFSSALVQGDVLLRKLAERFGNDVKPDADDTTKAFADAHAAWAGALAANYISFFVTIGRRAKIMPPGAPLKTLYERLVAADMVPVF
jgi:hypothetical protein